MADPCPRSAVQVQVQQVSSLKRTRSTSAKAKAKANSSMSNLHPRSDPPQTPTTTRFYTNHTNTPVRPPFSPIPKFSVTSIFNNVLQGLTRPFPNSFSKSITRTPSDNVPSSVPAMDFPRIASIDPPEMISTPLPPPSSPLSDLSELSRSPTPPGDFDLIDCDSSCDSSMLSSAPSSMEASPSPDSSSNSSDERPTKRRRISADSKVPSTQLLDLRTDDVPEHQKEQFDKLMKLLQTKQKIVVVAGAGISVSAGIPDFRSSKGLFKTLKKQHNLKSSGKDLFDASVYRDADSTSSFHQMVRELSDLSNSKTPSLFHHMLSKLADEDRLLRLYTQNVDGLEMKTKSLQTTVPLNRKGPWPKTIQLHGGLQKMVCTKCNDMLDLDAELFDGPTPPCCEQCRAVDNARTEYAGKRSHGIGKLRPRMVLYNEHNPDDEAIGAVVKADLRTRPDALIVVGTTLKIPGVKRIVKEMGAIIRGRRDGLNVWINMDDPPVHKDYEWDIVVRGPCDRVAKAAEARIWDAPSECLSEEEADRLVASQSVEVQVVNTPSRTKAERSIPTPISSRQSSNPPAFKSSKVKTLDFKKEPGKEQKKKPGPKPGYKRVPKTKVVVQGIAKKGKKGTAVVKNSTLSFTASKSKTAVREKKRKSLGDDDSSISSSTGKENSPPPTVLIKNDLEQDARPLSPISETRSTSPTSGDNTASRSPKHSLNFIMN